MGVRLRFRPGHRGPVPSSLWRCRSIGSIVYTSPDRRQLPPAVCRPEEWLPGRYGCGQGCRAGRSCSKICAMRSTPRSEEHTSELQSLMRISYAVFCLKKKKNNINKLSTEDHNIKSKNENT